MDYKYDISQDIDQIKYNENFMKGLDKTYTLNEYIFDFSEDSESEISSDNESQSSESSKSSRSGSSIISNDSFISSIFHHLHLLHQKEVI